MSIDWDYLFSLNLEELNDETTAESLYDQLIEYTPDQEDDIQRLKRLFLVCKTVMQIKALEADVAVEEAESIAKRYDKNEIDLLRKELEIYKQSDVNGGDIAQKLSAANEQIYKLQNNIETLENELIKYKRKLNDLQTKYDVKDKEVTALRSEIDSLREEIDNQRQIDEQINERHEPTEKLREKNKQIQHLLDELRDIETVNLELANQVKKLKMELNSATNEIEINCNQMEMLRQQVKQLNQLNEEFVKEKTFLNNEIMILRENIDKYEKEDDTIADKFSEKIEQLRQLIQSKDEEIVRLKSMSIMPDKSLIDFQKEMQLKSKEEIEERDKQIELLKSQLNEAVIDMESQTEIIQKLMQQNEGEEQVSALKEQILSLNNTLKSIEDEVQTKDEELVALRKRINLYEKGEYGLKDALKEINDLEKHLSNRDHRIEEMIQQINQLDIKLNDSADQIELFKGESHGNQQNFIKTAKNVGTNFNKKDKIILLELQKQLLKLEEEKIALSEKLRTKNIKESTDKEQEYQEINKLKIQLKAMKTENFELQLGMKEILNGIRESDSKSAIIIECPSLERICQLLESRNISQNLTNIIALKAELDLVRGHNEQLRTEMRKLRNDYLKVISQYTQDLLESDSTIVDIESREKHPEVNEDKHINDENEQKDREQEKADVKQDYYETNFINDNAIEGQMNENEDSLSLSRNKEIIVINKGSQTLPMNETNNQTELKYDSIDSQTQTEENYAEITIKEEKYSDISGKQLCANCTKVFKIVDFLKNCIEKLQENIRSSETKYAQHLKLLQEENKNLMNSLNEKLNEKDLQLIEKETQINLLENKIAKNDLNQSLIKEESSISTENKVTKYSSTKSKSRPETERKLSSSCKTVLESIINCLQARLEHKDESIKQYRNMLQESKQHFENEMIRLIENKENEEKNSIDFIRMIDNEELQSALTSCVHELENCKTELNAKISQLEDQLEKMNTKLKVSQNENEQLKLKRSAPNAQLKQLIDQLREECNQKDLVINNLNKTIKDDRSMRAMSVNTKQKDNSLKKDRKVDNELFQEIANLRAEIETQKTTIKNLEVMKWEYEKNLREIKEQTKLKLKEKETQISELQKKLEKIKVRLMKNENERQVLQSKAVKKDSLRKTFFNKSSQTNYNSDEEKRKLKADLKKLRNENQELESEANNLKEKLELKCQIESELKIILQESLKREKLATIYEENMDLDKQYETLLQENSQLKVELRMAEFEFKRQSMRVSKT